MGGSDYNDSQEWHIFTIAKCGDIQLLFLTKNYTLPEDVTMQNQTVKVPLQRLQRQTDAFKKKIALHQSLTQSLAAEFESLKYLLADSLPRIESPSSSEFAAASLDNESPSSNLGVKSVDPESSAINKGVSSGELVTMIRRAAKEHLVIHYIRPDIPSRMAEIVLALKKQKKLQSRSCGRLPVSPGIRWCATSKPLNS